MRPPLACLLGLALFAGFCAGGSVHSVQSSLLPNNPHATVSKTALGVNATNNTNTINRAAALLQRLKNAHDATRTKMRLEAEALETSMESAVEGEKLHKGTDAFLNNMEAAQQSLIALQNSSKLSSKIAEKYALVKDLVDRAAKEAEKAESKVYRERLAQFQKVQKSYGTSCKKLVEGQRSYRKLLHEATAIRNTAEAERRKGVKEEALSPLVESGIRLANATLSIQDYVARLKGFVADQRFKMAHLYKLLHDNETLPSDCCPCDENEDDANTETEPPVENLVDQAVNSADRSINVQQSTQQSAKSVTNAPEENTHRRPSESTVSTQVTTQATTTSELDDDDLKPPTTTTRRPSVFNDDDEDETSTTSSPDDGFVVPSIVDRLTEHKHATGSAGPSSEGVIFGSHQPRLMLIANRFAKTCGCKTTPAVLHIIADHCDLTHPESCRLPCSAFPSAPQQSGSSQQQPPSQVATGLISSGLHPAQASEGVVYASSNPRLMLIANRYSAACGCKTQPAMLRIIADRCDVAHLENCRLPCSVFAELQQLRQHVPAAHMDVLDALGAIIPA